MAGHAVWRLKNADFIGATPGAANRQPHEPAYSSAATHCPRGSTRYAISRSRLPECRYKPRHSRMSCACTPAASATKARRACGSSLPFPAFHTNRQIPCPAPPARVGMLAAITRACGKPRRRLPARYSSSAMMRAGAGPPAAGARPTGRKAHGSGSSCRISARDRFAPPTAPGPAEG